MTTHQSLPTVVNSRLTTVAVVSAKTF